MDARRWPARALGTLANMVGQHVPRANAAAAAARLMALRAERDAVNAFLTQRLTDAPGTRDGEGSA